jgi:hypothetical protein
MKMTIEEAIERAKKPETMFCPKCTEELFAPMDKLSICLYGQCPIHLEDNSYQEKNLLKLAQAF